MRHAWFAAALALAVGIWLLSSRPIVMPVDAPDLTDKIVHAVVYGVLAALLARGGLERGWRHAVLAAIALAVAYGVVDELHQSQVPGRDASVADVIADLVGALAGAALAARVYRRRRHGDRS